jgi:hypothetical protein
MHEPWRRAVLKKQGLPRSISDGDDAEVPSEGVLTEACEGTAPELVKESLGSPGCESLLPTSASALALGAPWLVMDGLDDSPDAFTDGPDRANCAPAPMTATRRIPWRPSSRTIAPS